MSKAQWKQPALKQAEKKLVDREQALQALQEAKFWKEQAEAYRSNANELRVRYEKSKALADMLSAKAEGYDYLRQHGVVLMGNEPKHLQGDDMDAYVNKFSWNQIGHRYSDALGKQLGQTKNAVLRQLIDASLLSSNPAGLRMRGKSVTGTVLDEAADNLAMHIDEHIKFKATGRYNFGTDTYGTITPESQE